jgi:HAD superfamily hydrolase (TIGR01484 family)
MSRELRLLGTDLDRTLLPNGPHSESPLARPRFRALCEANPDLTLVYISGRDKELVQRAIYAYMLPQPDFVISDVGTNIYDLRNGEWDLVTSWHEDIGRCWNGYTHGQLCQLLSGISGLRLQEYSKQNTYKISYYVGLKEDRSALDSHLSGLLRDKGVEASMVWSVDELAAVGLLDILPQRADKYHALDYLCQALSMPREAICYAGDSGNDLPLLVSDVPAVLVANAMSSVREEAKTLVEVSGNQDRLYFAQGDFLEMNGYYAAGLLEGVAHFFPEQRPVMAAVSLEGVSESRHD